MPTISFATEKWADSALFVSQAIGEFRHPDPSNRPIHQNQRPNFKSINEPNMRRAKFVLEDHPPAVEEPGPAWIKFLILEKKNAPDAKCFDPHKVYGDGHPFHLAR